MRLINLDKNSRFRLQEFIGEDIPPYGILSHTWGAATDEITLKDLEITLKDLANDTAENKADYAKLLFCAERVAADGLEWFWIDTCCIDKSSSAELSEAINSMYRWYHASTKCYVYLSDVSLAKDKPTESSGWESSFQKSR